MPVYSYRCAACGHAFDIRQEFSDDALTICPSCGGALRKVFGAVGVTFNGSGFYRTDSRSGSGGSGGASGSASGGGGSSTPSSTPAATPASGSSSAGGSGSSSGKPSTPA